MTRRAAVGISLVVGLLGVAGYGTYRYDLLPAGSAESAAGTATPSAPPSTPSPTVVEPVASSPPATPRPLARPGDTGERVRELQARLEQIAWYLEPAITGRYDAATEKAVSGFQRKRGLEATGVVDRRTWQRLLDMTRRPTAAEMTPPPAPGPTILGPEDSGRQVRELQARLKQIAWYFDRVTGSYDAATEEAVAGFQDKRGFAATGEVDRRTWDRLLEMTWEPTQDELHNRIPGEMTPGPLDPRCLTGRVMCIDKSTYSLRWVVDGKVLETVDVRFGAEATPTREGEFEVFYKSRDHVSSLFDTAMPFAMFFSGGQAVHYSPDFAAEGYSGASHGCVNVRDYDGIAELFDRVRVGDKVVVYWS